MHGPVKEHGLLRPVDLARLQRVFDEACQRREVRPESPEARDMALALLALYNAGMADEKLLVEAVLMRQPGARSA